MLKLNNITKQYRPGNPIIESVTRTFQSGNWIGLSGPNGSGKTTFLRVLSVNSYPTSGTVHFHDIDIHKRPSHYLKYLGLVHDEETLPDHLTAVELLEWVLRSRKMWNDQSEEAVSDLLNRLKLDEQRNEQIGTYSTGMKKKIQIAAAFIVEPQILIMDEPFRGLDTNTRQTVTDMIRDAKSQGKLILMASHTSNQIHDFLDEMITFPLSNNNT